jgi:hypothetical protein
VSQRTEELATWLLDESTANMALGWEDLRERLVEHFGCGRVMANQAVRVAREIRVRRVSEFDVPKIASAYLALYDDAVVRGENSEARRVLDSLRDMFGMRAPDRVHVSGSVSVELDKCSDAELAEIAGASRDVLQRWETPALPAPVEPDGRSSSGQSEN